MSKPINIGQSHNAMSVFANNVDWDAVDGDVLQRVIDNPREAGKHFTAFLRNGGRVIVGEPKVIPLNRSTSFNPVEFIGAGWSIFEQDERSLALVEIDLTAIRLEHMLKFGESSVRGETKLNRLKKTGHIRLDARIFQTFWENQVLIPERWKEKTNGNTTFIYFDGTVLQDSHGHRCVLCLYWSGGQWQWSCSRLHGDWHASYPSAVLAS